MKELLFSFVKTGLGGWLLHRFFTYFSFLIPGEKLIETNSLVAFHHPRPAYPLHVLIVPKGRYQTLQDLPSENLQFESELFHAIAELIEKFDLKSKGYRMIVNGGKNQEVPHLHFHLLSESSPTRSD
jgi:diadenosine tetraphosphate (Ap4A) HIT family hydrolase